MRIKEMTVDLEGNMILECIRVTGREMVTCMTCDHDGVCRVLLDPTGDASLLLGDPPDGAPFSGPVYTFTALPDTTGHLYERLIVRTYRGQGITYSSRVSQLYSVVVVA